MTTRIALICFDDMEELDLVGPWEVLRMWQINYPEDDIEVYTASLDERTVTCAKGLTITADRLTTNQEADVVVFPGGMGTRRLIEDEAALDFVRHHAGAGALMTSVCTGSLVYAAAGLLKDRPATTHWSALELLDRIDPSIEIRADDRFVDSGEVITASGVSAGIDMALHLIVRLHSEERARQVRRDIQYDPAPPV